MIRIRNYQGFARNYHIMQPVQPCPGCGSDDSILELWGVAGHYEVRCRTCGLDGPHGRGDMDAGMQAAIDAWNAMNTLAAGRTRTSPA